MEPKSVSQRSTLQIAVLTALLTAIATALGASVVNNWLPRVISYAKGDSVFVIRVTDDQQPVNNIKFVMLKSPDTKTPVSSGTTDSHGYVFLSLGTRFLSPGTQQFLLRGTLCKGSSDQDQEYSDVIMIEKLPDSRTIELKSFKPEKHADCLHPLSIHLIEITSLSVTSKKPYIHATLDERSAAYIDRSYSYTKIPSFLRQQDYVVTANDDKCPNDPAAFSLRLEVSEPTTVYIAHDDRYKRKPAWMKDFENANAAITLTLPGTNDEYPFTLYRKNVSPGTVVLGSNIDGTCQEEGNFGMYSVILVPTYSEGHAPH